MRAHLEAIVSELRRQRWAGEESLYLEDATLDELRELVAAAATDVDEATTAATTDPARPASADSFLQTLKAEEASTSSPPRAPVTETARNVREDDTGLPPPPSVELPDGDKQTRWDWLRDRVLGDPVCQQHVRPGKQVVFGVGNVDAEIFFCGEAPGADEEEQGEPFVGRAGQLLTKIIGAMGFTREDVYIGNIMNWRPEMPSGRTGNRPPTPQEMAYCLPFLRAQLAVVQPRVIVALGKTAVDGLLGPDPQRKMGRIRGQWHDFAETPLMVTFHPSYLLRNQALATKRQVWEDMLQVMEKVGAPISEKQRGYFLPKE